MRRVEVFRKLIFFPRLRVILLRKGNKVLVNYSLVSHVARIIDVSFSGMFKPQSRNFVLNRGSEYKHPLRSTYSLRTYEFHFMSKTSPRLFIYFFGTSTGEKAIS